MTLRPFDRRKTNAVEKGDWTTAAEVCKFLAMGISTHLFDGIRRLVSAVTVSLCLLVSQMAHAEVPSLAEAVSETSEAAQGSGHVHASEDPSVPDDHDGSGFDVKCASHCPSAFVFADAGRLVRDWRASTDAALLAGPLSGLRLPTADRPPRT